MTLRIGQQSTVNGIRPRCRDLADLSLGQGSHFDFFWPKAPAHKIFMLKNQIFVRYFCVFIELTYRLFFNKRFPLFAIKITSINNKSEAT